MGSGQWYLTDPVSYTLAGSVNDLDEADIPGLGQATVVRVSPSSAGLNITGIAAEAVSGDGNQPNRMLLLLNVHASNEFGLPGSDAGSAAANRFAWVGRVSVPAGGAALLWRDGTSSLWRGGALPATAALLLPVDDATAIAKGSGDATKQVRLECDTLVPTGTVVALAVPPSNGTIARLEAVTYALAREVTLVTITSTTETEIFNQTVAANLMGTNRMLRLTIVGDFLNNPGGAGTASPTIKVKVGGTIRYEDSTAALAAGANRFPVRMTFEIGMQNATNTMHLSGVVGIGNAGGATTGIGNLATDESNVDAEISSGATFTQDSTSSFAVAVTWTNSATDGSNISFRRHYAVLELV